MLSNIKRYCEMGFAELVKLKKWIRHSPSFDNFDPETWASPSLRIAQATNTQGETVCFCPIETVLVVSAYAVSPSANPIEAQHAGDLLDAQIAELAQRQGIQRVLMVAPKEQPGLPDGEWKTMRVYERKVPNAINTFAFGCPASTQATQYLN